MQHSDPARKGAAATPFDAQNKRDIYRVAAATMDLIQRHAALPDPISYAVWFSYAAKSNDALVDAVSKKLEKGKSLSQFDVAEIYNSFLAVDSTSEISQKIGAQFGNSMNAVSELILEGAKNNDSFRATLETLGQRAAAAGTAVEVDEIVSRLVVENEKMSKAMSVLDQGLSESQAQIERLNGELDALQKLTLLDPLTAVANRRAFDACLAQTIEQAAAARAPFCLAMTDIDHFKRVNDTLGHHSGDVVLKSFARILQGNTKGKDMVARCGGEEFAIILPQTDMVSAHNLMVKIAAEIRATLFLDEQDHGRIGQITASFGVSEYKPGLSAEDLFEQADSKLYDAKRSGRDCVKSGLTA
ncbi:MAG: GGDEF domain-containing protein [Hyphomonas sp.]